MSLIDFTKEATELGSTPKQDYNIKIDLGEDAPPKVDAEGKAYDAAAKDIAQEDQAKKNGGAYHNSAKMLMQVESAIVPRVSAMLTKEDHSKFSLDSDSEDLLVEMLVPVLEFNHFKPKDPTLPFVIAYIAIRWVPVWDSWQKKKRLDKKAKANTQENQAKGAGPKDGTDDDIPVTPTEEVDDEGKVLKKERFYYKDGQLATGSNIRICQHRNCSNALKKTQSKYCGHSCKGYEQQLIKLDNEE